MPAPVSPDILNTTEDPAFLREQIITYIGNKRTLLPPISHALEQVSRKLGGRKLVLADLFSGSGVVARLFKRFAKTLYVNDLEEYSWVLNRCYLTNRSELDHEQLAHQLQLLQKRIAEGGLRSGFITDLYAPQDESCIQPGERVFYTIRNAQYIDTARQEIARMPEEYQHYFLANLLYGASVHNNTAGVFKGFYKNHQGIGQYGGAGQNALKRILGDIELELPVFSRFECDCAIYQKEAFQAAMGIQDELDLAYLDPPYNQHPYGSNYFMLNLILKYQRPQQISTVSGIPAEWNHSAYNQRAEAQKTLFRLIDHLRAKYILISYSSEGFVSYQDFIAFLSSLGTLSTLSLQYNTYRASRNLNERDIHVKEYLFLLEKR